MIQLLIHAVEAAADAVMITRVDGRIEYVNPAFERLTGYSRCDALGRQPSIRSSGRQPRSFYEELWGTILRGETWRGTLINRRKDGSFYTVDETISAIRDGSGEITNFIAIEREVRTPGAAGEVVSEREQERKRIARELHDSAGQSLVNILVELRSLERSIAGSGAAETLERLRHLRQATANTIQDVGRLVRGLHPVVLEDLGLAAALERHAEELRRSHGVVVDLHLSGLEAGRRLPDAVALALYRAVQEATANAAQHSGARTVSVIVERREGGVRAIVEDDGQGFDPGDVGAGLGLLGVRERVELLGGSFTIESSPGHGTSLYIRLPLDESANGDPSPAGG